MQPFHDHSQSARVSFALVTSSRLKKDTSSSLSLITEGSRILNKKPLFLRSELWGAAEMVLGDTEPGSHWLSWSLCFNLEREIEAGVAISSDVRHVGF